MASKVRGCKSFTQAVISQETFQLSTFPPILMDLRKYISPICGRAMIWPCGPTDKASDYESGDCRFESCQGQPFYPPRKTGHSVHCSESSFNKSTNYTNTLSRKPSLIWTYVQLEKTTLSPRPVENQAHNIGIQFPLLEGDTFHNKIEKELSAPGWARTTNLSVNSRTR